MPISLIIALASLAASTYFRHRQQKAIEDAQRQRLAAEAARQRRIDEERQAAIEATLPKLGRQAQEAQQGIIEQQLANYLTPQARPASDGEYTADTSAPKEIREREARVLHDALAKGKDHAKNLARVSSFGRLSMDNTFDLGRLGENVARLNTGSARSSALLPLELQAAQRAGDRDAMYADIAAGIGQIAGMYYAMNPGTAAAASGGGGGLTIPEGFGTRTFAPTPGLRLPTTGQPAVGLRMPTVPRLTY